MAETVTRVKDEPLKIADREFNSRLILGTGKWRSNEEMLAALEASGCEMVTVALRRINFDDPQSRSILEVIDWNKYQILPNTAGCRTAEEAIRVDRRARAMGLSHWVKLQVIPDPKYRRHVPIGTVEAAQALVAEGVAGLPYLNADPVLAKRLEEIGCATVMPLGSPIGSGQGLPDFRQIQIIIEQANVPVIVDAGIGAPSDAALAMEIGADACLINTAIAQAGDPVKMARAMRLAIEAGRLCYLAGRIPKKPYASASSPIEGVIR